MNSIDLRTRLWGINSTNSVVIPKSFVLKFIVLGWILIYRNWSITPWNSIKGMTFSGLTCKMAFNGPAFYVLVQMYTVCYYLDSFQEFKEHLLGLLEQATLITSKMTFWRKAVLFPVFQLERVTSWNNNATVFFFWLSGEWNMWHT